MVEMTAMHQVQRGMRKKEVFFFEKRTLPSSTAPSK
jgi:hypothetical protein